jgi:hypothetical protein
MDVKATTPRLSAYLAFGFNWAPPAQTMPAGSSGDASARANAAPSNANAPRIIDVKARRVDPDPSPRKNPGRRQGNIFLSQPPATTYAPPQSTGQPVRLIQSAPAPGENLDTWA